MSSPVLDMTDPQSRLNGALWASSHPAQHGRMSMKTAVGIALVVELLIVAGLSQVSFKQEPPPPRKIMEVTMAPPPPPPPPEVKKLEPPPAPTPVKPQPKPQPRPLPVQKPPPAMPSATPKPANIAPAANPSPNAPALATANATPGPATAPAAPPVPAAPPALHGVVDGRGHCQAVQPQIPRRALQEGISATVIAHLSIGTDGSVSDVKIVRVTPPTAVFNEAVVTAAKAYRCEKNAEPYVGEVAFSFKTTPADDDE
ncbi:energy transducer TonB [Paraburkholderia phenoliruptrix]|uniref:energy transducer TonB n=1 Tax=Paraburkholderia phenoliruptrix TaxID=252970 RepID=UPI001C6E435C|nr:energy transducer TonB [Paraburkholderia phenoliruptrix]MBW9104656.1 energy transducer TonB [Paraburkholderia phenoliruptrix]MBW9130576.1 energy transducer TonB [Paraburkholderia ginsengiterrae]